MYFDIYCNGILSPADDLSVIKLFKDYEKDNKNINFSYNTTNNIYTDIRKYIPQKYLESELSEFNKQLQLMLWTHKLLSKKNKEIRPPKTKNFFSILEHVNNHNESVNCLTYATFLNEVFLSLKFKSRLVNCLPLDLRGTECHCMTIVYSSTYDKWIAFDPSFCTYYTDDKQQPLGINEIRLRLIHELPIYTPFIPSIRKKSLLSYLTKNMIRFQCYALSEYNIRYSAKQKTIYMLNPKGFYLSDKHIIMNNNEVEIIHTTDEDKFWNTPESG